MASLLNLERFTQSTAVEPPPSVSAPPPPLVAQKPEIIEEFDYEIVLDRGQFAGLALVAVVLLAVFSGGSYLIGRSMTRPVPALAQPSIAPALVAQTPAAPTPAAAPKAVEAAAPTSVSPAVPASTAAAAPLIADAVAGKVYLQVGAIEKGLASIWAEGLRTHGLDAFVSPGPSDKQWRVLVGPIPDPQAFQRTKDLLDNLGVNTFGRRYEP
jgi:cell division septation protein DedD